ncbi:hypothetical protein Y032_0056g2666 [Ancylostoma ceylanicum]|nr:hypothetical protein Y032_0056g2666 [Ancylostoma ceylanicum]
MFIALSFGDLANGLAFFLAGMFRISFIKRGKFYVSTPSIECFSTPWAVLMIFSGQFPALMNMFITLQRVVAFDFAVYYRRVWKNSYNYCLIISAVFLAVISIVVAIVINSNDHRENPTSICSVMQTTGIIYGTIHYALIAFVYLFCSVVLYAIFNKMNSTRVPSADDLRRQRMLLAINGVSVVLASIPGLLVTLNEWKAPEIDDLIIGVAYCCYAMHSGLSLIIYLTFRPDFRRRFVLLLHINDTKRRARSCEVKSNHTHKIATLNVGQVQT